MNTIPFKVNKNVIQKVGGYRIASSENNYTKFDFQFSDDWNKDGIQVSATMFFDEDKIPDPVLLTMRNDNTGYCYLPSVLKDEHGTLKLGLTGVYADDNNEKVVINTLLTSLTVGPGAYMTKYPANDIYLDILSRVASFDKTKQDKLICKKGITIDKDSNISIDDSVITTDNISRYTTPIEEEISELGKNKLNGKVIAGRVSNVSELLSYEPGIYFAVLSCEDIYPKLEGCIIAITDYDITIYINEEAIILYATKEELANEEAFKQLNLNKENVNQIKKELVTEIALKENISNKVNSIEFPSITYYPSTKAVWDYIDSKLEQPLANISDLKTNKVDNSEFKEYKNTTADKLSSFNIRINDLSLIKENVSNKVSSIINTSNVQYPSNVAVVDYITKELKEPKEKITALEDSRVTHLELQTVQNNLNTKIDDNKSNISDLQENKENVSNKINYIINPSTQNYPNNLAVINYVKKQLEQPLADIAQNATDITAVKDDVYDNAIKVTTDKSTSVVINDSSDSNIVDLKLSDNSAKVYLYGKNLADFNSYFKNANGWTSGEIAEKIVVTKDTKNKTVTFNSVNESGRSGINVMWKNSSVDYERLLTKTITISVDVLVTDDCTFFLCNSCDNYKGINVKLKANEKQKVSVTTTMPSDIEKIKNTSILFHIDGTKTNVTLSNFQIELNSVQTDYENYKEKQIISGNTDLSTVHTNYPTTTVIADNNFQLTYIADTKNYIDNKFNELATALVAHESEVN